MVLMGRNFYKQIFECYQKIKEVQDDAVLEKLDKLIEKVEISIQNRNREYQEVYSVIHEIRLYDFLQRNNISVRMSSDKVAGPDFECDFGYIECVSITKGEGKNKKAFENAMSNSINRYKTGETRITSVLSEKKSKYEKYIVNKNIDITKPRIIAVSTSILSNEVHHELSTTLMQKILFGIDTPVVSVKKQGVNTISSEELYLYNDITKGNNKEFKSAYFMDDDFKNISAVILNHNAFTEDINKAYFEIYLNPNANVPINISKIQNFNYFFLKSISNDEMIFGWKQNR